MKKLLLSVVTSATLLLGASKSAEAQAVEQGNMILAVQYGFPNLFGIIVKSAYNQSTYSGVKITNLGPVGLQFEYMVSDKVGLGLKMNYTNTIIKYDEGQPTYDSAGNQTGTTVYNYELSVPRIRIMPRFALHFGSSDKFDGYFGISAGYSSTKIKYKSNDPNYKGDTEFKSLVPIAFRLDVGGNYFFTDRIGLNFEIGLGGGPLVNLGIATKF